MRSILKGWGCVELLMKVEYSRTEAVKWDSAASPNNRVELKSETDRWDMRGGSESAEWLENTIIMCHFNQNTFWLKWDNSILENPSNKEWLWSQCASAPLIAERSFNLPRIEGIPKERPLKIVCRHKLCGGSLTYFQEMKQKHKDIRQRRECKY